MQLGPWKAFAGLCLGFLGASPVGAEGTEWSGLNPSTQVLARAGTGVTHPIAADLPPWSRRNAVDATFIHSNPALLSIIYEERGRIIPLGIQGYGSGGVFNFSDALSNRYKMSSDLAAALENSRDQEQRSKAVASTSLIRKELGLSLHLGQSRRALLQSNGNLFYDYHRNLGLELASGGPIYESDRFGSFDLGINFKGLFRQGDDFELAPAAVATTTLRDADRKRSAVAFGADYGFLYSVPRQSLGAWHLQLGFVWRDIGTTAYSIGDKASTGRKFSYLPNNQIFGMGLGLPNFRDGIRSALRIEYGEWTRRISASERIAASYEMRLPVWLAFSVGVKAKELSGGLSFRFPGFETEVASVSELLGEGNSKRKARSFVMELRSVL